MEHSGRDCAGKWAKMLEEINESGDDNHDGSYENQSKDISYVQSKSYPFWCILYSFRDHYSFQMPAVNKMFLNFHRF